MPASTRAALADWLPAFVERAATPEQAAGFVDFVDGRILAGQPDLLRDPSLVEDLHQSTDSQWAAFLDGLTLEEFTFALTDAAAGLAQSLARRGRDLGVLLKIYRTASQALWDYFLDVVATLGPDDPPRDEVLVLLFGRGTQWIDQMIESLIEVFYRERDQLAAGVEARHRQMVDAILAGDDVDAATASQVLGHALQRPQSCLILWVDTADAHTADTLRTAAARAARALDSPPPLTVTAGSRELWAWMSHPAPTSPEADAGDLGLSAPVQGALGMPAPGVAGFRATFEQARAAHELTAGDEHPPALTRYADTELLCLIGGRTPTAGRMAARELGGLAGETAALAVLRETALTYLVSGMRADAAASSLCVHPNTVRYRITRAEHFLGHRLTERTAHLEVALRYAGRFGVADLG